VRAQRTICDRIDGNESLQSNDAIREMENFRGEFTMLRGFRDAPHYLLIKNPIADKKI
jgi:hypothetical protein